MRIEPPITKHQAGARRGTAARRRRPSSSSRDDALDLVQAETSEENAGRLRVVWEEAPDLLVIDGQRVPPEEVNGRELRVAGGRHLVFARSRDRFAFERIYSWGPEPATAHLVYRSLVAPESTAELQRLEKQREWLELLLRTARVDLTPVAASTAGWHLLALRRLGLEDWVDGKGWGVLQDKERRVAKRVYDRRRPLAAWFR
jgi:hypothetical protein